MAESFKSGTETHALNDDIIRQALKTELGHLTPSDALIGRTLDKCAAELDKKNETRSLLRIMLGKTSLRYYAAVVAACLLVFAFLLNYPPLWGSHTAQDKNSTSAKTQATDYTGAGAVPESSAAPPANKLTQNFSESVAPTETPAPALAAPQMSDSGESGMSIMSGDAFIAPDAYRSLNDYGNDQTRGNGSTDVAFTALTDAYNQSNGTVYSYDASQALSVSTVAAGGVTSDMLKSSSSYHELLGSGSYWILPLKNDQGAVATLLPVFESGISDGSEYQYDISFRFSGKTWMSSTYLGIPADNPTILMMLDKKALEKRIQDTFNTGPATEVIIADISNGRDFMAFVTAGDKEYAIPLFTDNAINTLVNGQAYDIREAFNKLAGYLDSGNQMQK